MLARLHLLIITRRATEITGYTRAPEAQCRSSRFWRPRAAHSAEIMILSAMEREVLALLVDGHSLKDVSLRLAISETAANAHRRALLRKFKVSTTIDLIAHAVQAAEVSGDAAESRAPVRLQHQSRWLPDVSLSLIGPLGSAWRHAFNCRSLRDVADVLRECGDQPGPIPDHPDAVLIHGTGTLGAKQAVLAALAAECGRSDVELIVACHELELAERPESGERRRTLPLAACYLRCRAREVQIAEEGTISILHARAVSVVRVEPRALAAERLRLYQSFAVDWCRALDLAPAEFARLRAEQLHLAQRQSVVEDLLGHRLPPDYMPSMR